MGKVAEIEAFPVHLAGGETLMVALPKRSNLKQEMRERLSLYEKMGEPEAISVGRIATKIAD